MPTQFIFLKQYNIIINIEDIVDINFEPEEREDGEVVAEATLSIGYRDADGFDIEGDEAEKLYLQLIKKLPNIIVVE